MLTIQSNDIKIEFDQIPYVVYFQARYIISKHGSLSTEKAFLQLSNQYRSNLIENDGTLLGEYLFQRYVQNLDFVPTKASILTYSRTLASNMGTFDGIKQGSTHKLNISGGVPYFSMNPFIKVWMSHQLSMPLFEHRKKIKSIKKLIGNSSVEYSFNYGLSYGKKHLSRIQFNSVNEIQILLLGKMFLLLVFITECYSFITYDAGYASSFAWINGYRECWKNDNDTKEFTFSGQFERVPQILLIMSRYNLDQLSPNGYDFLITQISQTSKNFIFTFEFFASIYCKYNIKTYETPFYWFAYDDNRVQVISEYNYDIPTYTGTLNKLKTYPHNNPNFQKAIIQLTSFHSTGVWDFVLSVVGLTKTDVTISIKSNNSNFIRVGYQIFLSVDSAITIDPQIITTSILYTSPTITFPTNKNIAISTQGFKWSTTFIRLDTSYAANYYTYGTWDDSRSDELRFTPIYFLKVIPVIYKPMLGKVRISQTDSLTPLVIPFFELDIIELTKIYNSPQIETLYIGSDITNLNLILKYNCPSQYQLSLNLLTQISQITNRKIACQKKDNLVAMYFTFRPQTTAIQELQLTITSNSITLSQKVQNVVVENIQLLKLIFSI